MLDIDFSEVNKIKKDKYRRVSGIFAIDKPVGLTSHDIVDMVRKKLKIKKVGHAGALDPFATGVLLILAGKYTKKTELLIKQDKAYDCRVLFGITTDSHDIDGHILDIDKNFELEEDKLKEVIGKLNKNYYQYVPIFSSVKLNGIKLRELARNSKNFDIIPKNNKKYVVAEIEDSAPAKMKKKSDNGRFEFELPGKEVNVDIKINKVGKLSPEEVKKYNIDVNHDLNFADLSIDCSKGTYIRQIAYDLGELLVSFGMLVELRRTRISEVELDQSITIDELQSL